MLLGFFLNYFNYLTKNGLFWFFSLFQVQELHKKLSEESRRADNFAFEMKKLEEKHETGMKEKEVRQISIRQKKKELM